MTDGGQCMLHGFCCLLSACATNILEFFQISAYCCRCKYPHCTDICPCPHPELSLKPVKPESNTRDACDRQLLGGEKELPAQL